MTIQQLINERAVKYATDFNDKTGHEISYKHGATSMLPVMEDVAVRLITWSNSKEGSDWINENLPASYKDIYQHFIEHVYQIK